MLAINPLSKVEFQSTERSDPMKSNITTKNQKKLEPEKSKVSI